MSKKSVHVVKSGDGWAVKKEGTSRAASVHRKQDTAWKAGIKVAKKEGGEAYLHGRDGRIRERNSYSKDPNPPKG